MNPGFRFGIFITIFICIIGFATYYLGRRLVHRAPWKTHVKVLGWAFLVLIVLLQIIGPAYYRQNIYDLNRPYYLQWATYISLGFFAYLVVLTAGFDVVGFIQKTLFKKQTDLINSGRRDFLRVTGISAGATAVGMGQVAMGPKVYDLEVPFDNLPADLWGFKIAQITDLHTGPLIDKKYVENVVAMTNALKPDLIALTGDFIDGTIAELRDHVSPLSKLNARYGIYYTTGNHEYYWGADAWVDHFKSLGAIPLNNEHKVVTVGLTKMIVAGVTDNSAGMYDEKLKSDPQKSILGAPEDASFKLLLAHQPKSCYEAFTAGFDLQLSGHTHAGQFFPWNILVRFAHPYYKGLNLHNNKMWVYVSRGTGYWGPPVRTGVPSEITMIRLIKGVRAIT